jgi:hypothetical protein
VDRYGGGRKNVTAKAWTREAAKAAKEKTARFGGVLAILLFTEEFYHSFT